MKTLLISIFIIITSCFTNGDNFHQYLVKDLQYNIEGSLYTPHQYCEGDIVYYSQLKKKFLILKQIE